MANPNEEVARLHISIESNGTEQAAANLEQVKTAAGGAASELNRVADAANREETNLDRLNRQILENARARQLEARAAEFQSNTFNTTAATAGATASKSAGKIETLGHAAKNAIRPISEIASVMTRIIGIAGLVGGALAAAFNLIQEPIRKNIELIDELEKRLEDIETAGKSIQQSAADLVSPPDAFDRLRRETRERFDAMALVSQEDTRITEQRRAQQIAAIRSEERETLATIDRAERRKKEADAKAAARKKDDAEREERRIAGIGKILEEREARLKAERQEAEAGAKKQQEWLDRLVGQYDEEREAREKRITSEREKQLALAQKEMQIAEQARKTLKAAFDADTLSADLGRITSLLQALVAQRR